MKEIIPQLQSESTSIPFEEVASKINELKLFSEVIENKSISILDYTEAIPNLIKERYLTKEDFLEVNSDFQSISKQKNYFKFILVFR